MPDVSALDSAMIEKAFLSMMSTKKNYALQYGGGQGDLRLREQVQEIMALDGVHGSVEDITITTGSQHGLELIADLFLDAGDAVLVEAPSYVGAVGIFRHKEAHIEHVFTDAQGISPEALTEAADRLRAEGKKIKLLYVVPNFANPSGVTLSAERRAKVLEICKERGILIVEDNPYGLLYFDQKPPAAIASLDSENVVYLGSFSKILSPGLRVGYVLAPPAIREKLVLANESAILSPASFAQMLVSEYLSISDWQGQIETFRQLYKTKRDAALEALAQYLPRIETTVPTGGFFLWLTLPEGLNSKEMLPLAVNELVAYTPGTAFYGDGRGANNIRVCFSHPTAENVKVGIKRLSNVVNLQLDLLDTFSSKD
jgi:DNA-binding transcriptional MocR family regulator